MKLRDKIITGSLIIILILLHRYLFQAKEGFLDDSSKYATLKERLMKELGSYCKVASFVRSQLQTMLSSTGGESDARSLDQTYKSIYSCSDSLANSRPSCSIGAGIPGVKGNPSMIYVSCDTYMKLPDWSDEYTAILALMKITDDLPERMVRESEWFAAIIDKLQGGLAAGANPPTTPPTADQLNNIKAEGFNGKCSIEATRVKMKQQIPIDSARLRKAEMLESEIASCSLPSVSGEIDRINALLDSPSFKNSISKMDSQMDTMIKLQSDLQKAQDGTLYSWQQDGPPKNYMPPFKGGDRTMSFLYSLKQNQ